MSRSGFGLFYTFFIFLFSGFLNWRSIRRVFLFFLFYVVFPATDIGTDINTGMEFYYKKDYYWALCTILLIFAPFGARCLIFIFEMRKCVILELDPDKSKAMFRRLLLRTNTARIEVLDHELMKLLWHLPPFSLLR